MNISVKIKSILPDDCFDLNGLQKHLESIKYYGTLTLVWQEGKIVLIREERTFKPGSFSEMMI